MKKALITGITGQDGSYLAELLLSKGYKVYGIIRRNSNNHIGRIQHIEKDIDLIHGDLLDLSCLTSIIDATKPDEVYNLAAQSYVPLSWKEPIYTSDVNALGAHRLLEALCSRHRDAKFYQASSSEMFGNVVETPQTENTPFNPRSPYGVSKCYAHYITKNYRESYDMFACSGICFNHESPRRGTEFVTQKIVKAVADIYYHKTDVLKLGNIEAKRDWGYAKDYMGAAYLMLQQDIPDDYIISTGETHSVEEFVQSAFEHVGLDWKSYVLIDPVLYRPAEVDVLLGDSSKIQKIGWQPTVDFSSLVCMMVDAAMMEVRDNL